MDPRVAETVKDLVLAVALACVGVGGFLFVNPTDAQVFDGPGGMSWRSLPFIYSGLLLFLVAVLAASTLHDTQRLRRGREPLALLGERPPSTSDRRTWMRRALTVAAIFLYAAGIEAFGFAISTPLLLFAMLTVLGQRNFRRSVLLALVGGLLLWILFVGVLKLPMTGLVWDPVTPVLDDLYRMTGAR